MRKKQWSVGWREPPTEKEVENVERKIIWTRTCFSVYVRRHFFCLFCVGVLIMVCRVLYFYFCLFKYTFNLPNTWPDTCPTTSINYGRTLSWVDCRRLSHADDVARYVGLASTITERIRGRAAFGPLSSSRSLFVGVPPSVPCPAAYSFVSFPPSAHCPAADSFVGYRHTAACGPMSKSLAVR